MHRSRTHRPSPCGLFALVVSILSAGSVAAQETRIETVVAIEGRAESGLDVEKTRATFEPLEPGLHRCFWERRTSDFPPDYRSRMESDWRVTSDGNAVKATVVKSGREGEVVEERVLACFEKQLTGAQLKKGQVRVLLSFSPRRMSYPQPKVTSFRFVGPTPNKRYAKMLEAQVRADRSNLCVSSQAEGGSVDAHVTISAEGYANIEAESHRLILSCALGLERNQVLVPPNGRPVEFKATVTVQKGPDRRPFEARTLLGGIARLDEGETRYQTQFADAEVWRKSGLTSTNRLRSVCMAAAAQPEDQRAATGCAHAKCACSTERFDDSWGKYCQPYIDAGRPKRVEFAEQMFATVLSEHAAALRKCGDACAPAATAFKQDCGAFMGGTP